MGTAPGWGGGGPVAAAVVVEVGVGVAIGVEPASAMMSAIADDEDRIDGRGLCLLACCGEDGREGGSCAGAICVEGVSGSVFVKDSALIF